MTPVRQPTPSVTEADVERIVRRDYPANVAGEILELIATVSVREKPRVVLACLKIASGDLNRLGQISHARADTTGSFWARRSTHWRPSDGHASGPCQKMRCAPSMIRIGDSIPTGSLARSLCWPMFMRRLPNRGAQR